MKVAILIDGEWFRRRLDQLLGKQPHGITADIMYRNALLALQPGENLFRVFYYDCPPFGGKETNPISGQMVDFKPLGKFQARTLFLKEMGEKPFVALRLGEARNRGWTLSDSFIKRAMGAKVHIPPAATDVFVNLEQKGVDMRIGIDVATLALKRIADRIVLISGDTDSVASVSVRTAKNLRRRRQHRRRGRGDGGVSGDPSVRPGRCTRSELTPGARADRGRVRPRFPTLDSSTAARRTEPP